MIGAIAILANLPGADNGKNNATMINPTHAIYAMPVMPTIAFRVTDEAPVIA